jgi:hypothetical protein
MNLNELADRIAVEEIIYRYPHCLDTGQFALIAEEIFTPDAELRFGETVIKGGDAIAAAIGGLSSTLRSCSHNVTNVVISVKGETAKATYRIMAWHWFKREDGDVLAESEILSVGGYNDEFVRTSSGWRVRRRQGFMQGQGVGATPDHMRAICEAMISASPAWPS